MLFCLIIGDMDKDKISQTIEIQYDNTIVVIKRGMQDRMVLSRQEAEKIAKAFLDRGLC